jgi:hypothetical protein
MSDLSELELKLSREFASKGDLKRVEGKVDAVSEEVISQGRTLALLEQKLTGILSALNKITWIIVAPIVLYVINLLIRMGGN